MSDKVGKKVQLGTKSYLILSFGLVAIVAGLIACNDEVRKVVGVQSEKFSEVAAAKDDPKGNPYSYVGEEHNAQVDFVLREFAKKWKKNMKKSEICAALNAINAKYLAGKGRSAELARFYPPDDPCAGQQSVRGGRTAQLRMAGVSYDPNFSTRAIDLANEVQNIMLSSGSAWEVANRLVPINSEAMGMGEMDAALVLGVSSIAASSAAYWEANLDTWVTVYSQGGYVEPLPYLRGEKSGGVKTHKAPPQYNWSGVSEVGWSDVGGGIVGGIRGALGGPGGVVVGIGTGAAYSSITAAIGQIVKILQRL